MATFQYRARTAAGDQIAGVIQADNETAVVRALDERNLYPIRIAEQRDRRARVGGKIRLRDIGVMYGQLADLLRAGVPLLRALETIARAGVGERLAKALLALRDGVSAGKALADAMADAPTAFPSLHVAMIRAGEKAGFLEDVLSNISTFIERVDELRSKIRGAMIYPLVLSILGVTVTIGMLVWFVPRFRPIFGDRVLPWPTRMMFGLSDAMMNQWPVLLGAGCGAVGCVWWFIRSEWGRRVWERWRLKIPVLGRVIRTISVTRFCRILGTMLANGVPILQALAISKDATGSVILADSIEEAAEAVRAGESLSAPLRAGGLFPVQILEMIAVAEESNQLEKVLVEIADTVERRTDRQVDQAVHLIEPLILVLMAITIGLLAVGLLYPILTMAQTLGG
jgi:general secretion pathway protein F